MGLRCVQQTRFHLAQVLAVSRSWHQPCLAAQGVPVTPQKLSLMPEGSAQLSSAQVASSRFTEGKQWLSETSWKDITGRRPRLASAPNSPARDPSSYR
jgi:hypothetical protein